MLQHAPIKAEASFYKSLRSNPHFCLARVTFALFLIEQNKLQDAQHILEEGLSYPIPPEYAENYLNYLAKLRSEQGNHKAATKVLDRLEELDLYNSDYSDLIA